jgi:hypothetical protein
MALGEGGGRNFLFQQRGQAIPQQQQPWETETEPEINPMGEGLRATSGQITDYYQAYGNLNSYAKSMWKTHGFDVTKADYTDPAKIKAHDVYLQGAAYVNELQNKLKFEAKESAVARQQAASNADYVRGDQSGLDTYDPSLNINLGTTSRVTNILKLAKGYDDEGNWKAAQKLIDNKKAELQAEADAETNPGRKRKIENEVSMINDAYYNPNKDEDQEATAAYRQAVLDKPDKEDPKDYTGMALSIAEFQSGDMRKAKNVRDGSGALVYSSVIHSPALGKAYLTREDNKKIEVIDLRTEDGGRAAALSLFNVGNTDKISMDQLDNLDKDLNVANPVDKKGNPITKALPDIDKAFFKKVEDIIGDIQTKKSEGDEKLFAGVESGNLTFVPGTKDEGNVVVKPETVITNARRKRNAFGVKTNTFEMTYHYQDEDLKDQKADVVWNLKDDKDLKEFREFMLFNAAHMGVQVTGGATDDSGKKVIPGFSPAAPTDPAAPTNPVPEKAQVQPPAAATPAPVEIPTATPADTTQVPVEPPVEPPVEAPAIKANPTWEHQGYSKKPQDKPVDDRYIPMVGSATAKDSLGNKIPQLPNYEGIIVGSKTAE